MEQLVDIVHFIHMEIHNAFGTAGRHSERETQLSLILNEEYNVMINLRSECYYRYPNTNKNHPTEIGSRWSFLTLC